MEVTTSSILSDLNAGHYAPVYFLQGEEPFFIDLVSDAIEKKVIPDKERSFNQVILYGKEANMATILTHARRFPMMAERQVVIVREAQEIPDLNRESGSRLLLDYLSHPVPTTLLVFCHKHKTLDKRKELGKSISKLALTLNAKRLYDNQLPDFVRDYVNGKGFAIDDHAVQVCCEYIGNALSRLANELDKLMITLKPGDTITTDQVMSQVGVSREYNIFELQRAIVARDHYKALQVVRFFEGNARRNPAIVVVAFLYSFFSKLLAAASSEVKDKDTLIKTLKISPYAFRDYSSALRNYSHSKLMSNVGYLREADLRLKGVDAVNESEGLILRELVFKLLM